MERIGFGKRVLPAVAALALAGCTTITISSGQDEVVVSGLGHSRIKVFGLAPVAVQARGLGVASTPQSFNLGWYSQTGIYTTGKEGECRIVLLSSGRDELQALLAALRAGGADLSNVCIDRSIDPQGVPR